MWTSLLLVNLLALAWHRVAAAPVADAGLIEAMLFKREEVCRSPGAPATLYKLSFTGSYTCDSGTYATNQPFTRVMQEFVSIDQSTGRWTGFHGCTNIERVHYYGDGTQFVAEHYWGPVTVDDGWGKRECCYTLRHQFNVGTNQGTLRPVPIFDAHGSELREGCSKPEEQICPAQYTQIECRSTREDSNVCPWTGDIPRDCRAL